MKVFTTPVRFRVLLRPLAVEHVEPVIDGDSDSVSDGTTISISVSASKISLGWFEVSQGETIESGVSRYSILRLVEVTPDNNLYLPGQNSSETVHEAD
jgi:hypothetical protein